MSVVSLVHMVLGYQYIRYARDDFSIISDLDAEAVAKAYNFSMYAKNRVRGIFPELDFSGPDGVWEIVLTSRTDDLITYLSAISDGGGIIPGGVFLLEPEPHFLMPFHETDTMDGALSHELIHGSLRDLPTPLWAEEGMAMAVEINMGHRQHPAVDRERIRRLRDHFTTHEPASVADDDAFWNPIKSEHSYDLSFRMVSSLLNDRERFFRFLTFDHWDQSGANALKEIYGLELGELAKYSIFPKKPTSFFGRIIHGLFGVD